MLHVTIITGSTLGSAEYVGEHLADKLEMAGFTTELLHGADLDELPLEGIWLVVTSTHGAGELPDNLQPLWSQLNQRHCDLHNIQFGAIGLGSSEYDTFCYGIIKLDNLLAKLGAKRIGERAEIDVIQHPIPEDPAEKWLQRWINLLTN